MTRMLKKIGDFWAKFADAIGAIAMNKRVDVALAVLRSR